MSNDQTITKKKFSTRIKHLFFLTIKKATDPFFAGTSAELAFFILLALVPTLILVAQIFGVFTAGLDIIMDVIKEYVSPQISEALTPLLTNSSKVTTSIALIVLAVWASSKAQFSMSRITNYAYTGHAGGKGFIKERLRAMLSIIIIIVTLAVILSVLVYGKNIIELTTTYLNDFLNADFEFDSIWFIIRWPLAVVAFLFMVTAIYFILPSDRIRIRDALPGSLFSTVGMLIATWVFSYYVSYSTSLDLLYGSLTSIVALLLWFYILSFIIILGIQINSVWEESGKQVVILDDDAFTDEFTDE